MENIFQRLQKQLPQLIHLHPCPSAVVATIVDNIPNAAVTLPQGVIKCSLQVRQWRLLLKEWKIFVMN